MNSHLSEVGIEQRVQQIVAGLTEKPLVEITSTMTWRMLGLDSLDMFNLLVALEQEFEMTIPDSAALTFYCINDITHYIDSQ